MSHVKVLTSATCSYCVAAKKLLQQQGIDFDEIDLHRGGNEAKQLLIQSGQRTVPQIFINDKSIGGYTELSKLIKTKQLELTPDTL